jgi:predicted nucleic acid-binding protein
LILYFDTSALVPLIVEEPGSQIAARLWDEADVVVSSRLVYPEGRAALAMALGTKRVDEPQLRTAVDAFDGLYEQLHIVDLTQTLARSAGAFAEQFALRGYDAVHLASVHTVADSDVVLAAGDQRLLTAARTLGMATADLTAPS